MFMDEELFLTPDEIRNVTGYKQSKKQRLQLAAMGIPFGLDGTNKPIVLRKVIKEILGLSKRKARARSNERPNFF